LSSPILFSEGLLDVLEGDEFRVYPPTQLEKGKSPQIDCEVAYIPTGSPVVHQFDSIKYKSTTGFVYTVGESKKVPIFHGYGIRIDVKGGRDLALRIQRQFLSAIRSMCLQWWLIDSLNPFDLKIRFASALSAYGLITDILPSGEPKYPMHTKVLLTGVEKVVGRPHWDYLRTNCRSGFHADKVKSLFCDSLSKFYVFDHTSAVLYLALALEAAEYEARSLTNKRTHNDPLRNLKKHAEILKFGDYETLRMLFIDRGHIAHSQPPPHLGKDETMIFKYITESVRAMLARELQSKGVV
jgi:hypothetical protein